MAGFWTKYCVEMHGSPGKELDLAQLGNESVIRDSPYRHASMWATVSGRVRLHRDFQGGALQRNHLVPAPFAPPRGAQPLQNW